MSAINNQVTNCDEANEPISNINKPKCLLNKIQPLSNSQSTGSNVLFRKLIDVSDSSSNTKKPNHLCKQTSQNSSNKVKDTAQTKHFCINFSNIRSLFCKLSFVTNYLYTKSADILFLTETWLTSNISDSMVCPLNYNLIRRDRSISKGGGVCVFYKNVLKVIETRYDEVTDLDQKFEYVCIDLFDGNLSMRLCCFPRL